jgi:hypothetical protein
MPNLTNEQLKLLKRRSDMAPSSTPRMPMA